MYNELEKIPPEIIADYRKTRESQGLSPELQIYIDQLERSVELYRKNRSVRKAAKELNADFKDISFNTCRQRIYDAINYFHLNSTVKEEAWYHYYADYHDELSKKAENAKDYKEARLAARQAAEYRIQASKVGIDPDLLRPKDQILNPDISPERLGLEEFNLKKLWVDTGTFIEQLQVDSASKQRIKEEARQNLGIDTDYEEVD